jgi:hypothetical protein
MVTSITPRFGIYFYVEFRVRRKVWDFISPVISQNVSETEFLSANTI